MATTITANGINFPDGSAGSPSIGGTDTNTGLFTGSDIVGFATGGSERLRIDASGNIDIANDSGKLRLGTGNDLNIYHNGTHSYIVDSGTGNLILQTSKLNINNADGTEGLIHAAENGKVELYYDNSIKLETTSAGVTVTGDLTTGQLFIGDGGPGATDDNICVGDGKDLKIYHDGNSVLYDNGAGNFVLYSNGGAIKLQKDTGEQMVTANTDGAVELYHDNSKKFETTADGIKLPDAGKISFNDVSYIWDNNTNNNTYWMNPSNSTYIDIADSSKEFAVTANSTAEAMIKAIPDAQVELYYNGVDVFKTNSSGIQLKSGGSSQISFYDVSTATIIIYTHSTGLRWWDDVNDDPIMELSQSGNLNIDGSYSNSGVDYAEYFESTDGSAIAIGTTVVLEDGKVRAATSSETPIGVIRPKTSGTSVTGGVNQLNWQGKYLVDDYDGQVMESAVHCTWTDNNEVNQQCWKDRPPTGVTIPSDAVETTRERPKLNPLFDESKTYVPRSERDEWNCVGLLGQIPITKGQPTSSSWIKMKDKTSTVELWMVK